MLAGLYLVVLAPSGNMCFIPEGGFEPEHSLGFSRDHLTLYVSGGAISAVTDTGGKHSTWARQVAAEVLVKGFLLEGRLERFLMPEPVDYNTVRVGGMSRRPGRVTGGVTVGFRDVRGPRPHDGVEVAFPLVFGGAGGWLRLETAYVFSERQSSWNYRVHWERLLGNGPFIVGARLDLDSWEIREHGRLSHGVLGVLLGTSLAR